MNVRDIALVPIIGVGMPEAKVVNAPELAPIATVRI
jgi:hypothetical protein